MKKLAILACVMTVSAGISMAQESVSVPFVGDNANGLTSFIGIQNVGAGSVVITASYLDAAGGTPTAAGTFALAAGESISYRVNSTLGGEVQPAGLADFPVSYGGFGSARFDVPAGGAVAGRYVQWGGIVGSFAHNLEVK